MALVLAQPGHDRDGQMGEQQTGFPDRGAPGDLAPVPDLGLVGDLDALIVVSSPWADGASAAARTMEWLSDQGMTSLLRRTIVVLNDSDGHAGKRTRELLAREFVDHGQPVVEVPFDPHLRPGGVVDVDGEMALATRRRFLQITATIAGYFAARSDRGRNRPAGGDGR